MITHRLMVEALWIVWTAKNSILNKTIKQRTGREVKKQEETGNNRKMEATGGQTEQTNNYVAERTPSLRGTYSDSYLQTDKYFTDWSQR